MTTEELTRWLAGVAKSVKATQSLCVSNKVPGCPIPFFGSVLDARVLTVGVNPSGTEVVPGRDWVRGFSVEDWQDRMLGYFRHPTVRPSAWFETWSICLELIGKSYHAGTAAHLDMSPRPTTPMLDPATDKQEFRTMVKHDVRWFFEILGRLPEVKLLLVAGPIPKANGKKQQLAEFIQQSAGEHGANWIQGHLPKLAVAGRQKEVPVFVCPFDSKVNGLYAMVRHVYRHRATLREQLL